MRATLVALALSGATADAFNLQAHRGGRGLLPESTLVAFDNALSIGVTTLETDVAITADGVAVLSHDALLNPAITRDASGAWLAARGPTIHKVRYADLAAFDVGRINPASKYARDFPLQQPHDGARIPRLADLFALVKARGATQVHFDIETKINPHHPDETLPPEAFVDVLLKEIRAANMVSRVMVQSFDWRTLEILHRREPALRTMYLTIASEGFHTLKDGAWTAGHLLSDHGGSVPRMVKASARRAKKSTGVIWAPNFRNLTPALVKEAHALGLKVIPWTVNQTEQMSPLMDWGVDGIITDYPDRLRELMARRGVRLPVVVHNR
ncbi:MAG: glycerophosphodiester phosphodiesterase [Burkholderiales bacterium]|nr:glycerophosphodiester phosphodiesterase [Burkholderiales bacterium]